MFSCPRIGPVDKLAANTVVSVRRMHRDLFHVSSAVNGLDEQIGDWAIGGVDKHPRPPITLKPAKDFYRRRRVIGHLMHTKITKCVARGPLDVSENR